MAGKFGKIIASDEPRVSPEEPAEPPLVPSPPPPEPMQVEVPREPAAPHPMESPPSRRLRSRSNNATPKEDSRPKTRRNTGPDVILGESPVGVAAIAGVTRDLSDALNAANLSSSPVLGTRGKNKQLWRYI